MQLTPDFLLSLAVSALAGATVAYLGNRVMNAEMWGHVKKHCAEIEALREITEKRLDAHTERLQKQAEQIAVLLDWKRRVEREREA